ncbi:MAG: ABC transporter ATP-binding protein [Anaerolineae bacterium]|nr:ABC transporter ATP-binding protein [Anaerolineae bacterium]
MSSSAHHPLRRLLTYARSHRRAVVLASLFSVLNKVFDLAPPILIGTAVDVVVQRDESLIAKLGVTDGMSQLWVLAGLTLLVWILESAFEYAHRVLWRNLAQTLQHEMRIDAYTHVQGLELAYFEDQSTGGLLAILNDDVNQLERFLDVGANALLQVLVTVIVVGGLFFYTAPQIAWMVVIPMPFIVWGSVWFQRMITPRYAAVREQVSVLNSHLSNNLGGIVTIKSFTTERHETARIHRESERYRSRNRQAIALSSAFSPVIRIVIVLAFIAIMVFGGRKALNGELNVGVFSMMVLMTQRFLWPLTALGETFDLYQRAMASATRILDLLDIKARIVDGWERLPTQAVRGDVTFDDVYFAYNNGSQVLRGLSLDIPAGDTAAIVGATGAGKSTIIKLLLRFYDVQAGAVCLDSESVHHISLSDLRRAIGLVSQDVFLFHGTVRENITYGTFDASMDQIIEAARIAEAHDFIMALPDGYDTIVGERGQKLSGGQRQRISIARAVLKNPPILVLDEATSSVDNETEAAIQRSMERIAVGRTMIVIAHRLSTIRNADRIFVLEQGRVCEQGRHDDLVQQNGLYAALWRVQTGERTRVSDHTCLN